MKAQLSKQEATDAAKKYEKDSIQAQVRGRGPECAPCIAVTAHICAHKPTGTTTARVEPVRLPMHVMPR